MTPANAALQDFSAAPPMATVNIERMLPTGKIAGLLDSIRRALPQNGVTPVVHFVSTNTRDAVETISLETALAAAQAGKRVLFVDAGARTAVVQHLKIKPAPVLGGPTPLVAAKGLSLCFTSFSGHEDTDAVRGFFNQLRPMFDLIVVHSESALQAHLPFVISGLADASVMVIEAERTRVPVARELKSVIESHGGRVIGAVLNRRKFHITDMVYSLLFR